MMAIADAELYARLRDVLNRGWINLPESYGGTGAPGKLLEVLLGIDGGNQDTPDNGKWEIKFHSRASLLTLFHLEAQPKGHLYDIVKTFGWRNDKGYTAFRHTIHGRSKRGFYVKNAENKITVCHDSHDNITYPYWTHDSLINAFAAKFRRLIVVKGKKQ